MFWFDFTHTSSESMVVRALKKIIQINFNIPQILNDNIVSKNISNGKSKAYSYTCSKKVSSHHWYIQTAKTLLLF
jgi:pyruvate-formate lyase